MRFRLLAICVVLFAAELAFLPLPGIQQDEALFVAPFLRMNPVLYAWRIGGVHVPVMSMTYLGSLKSWLYWPVFHIWPPGVLSMRLPVCLIAICTLVIFADLVRRVSGSGVALLAALFLATDAIFVMTNVFDPTTSLQTLGTVAFLNLLHRSRFAAAFFVAGIALWSKADVIFALAGILLGFVLIYPRATRQFLTPRNVALAAAAFLIGAAPLVDFNLHNHAATIHAAGDLPPVPPTEKLMMLRRTLDGRAYEHVMFRSTVDEILPLEGAPFGELALRWYRQSHWHPGSFLLPAMILALLALPFLRGSPLLRPVLFSWTAFAGTIGSMFFLADAGAGPHHTVLAYPAPQFIVAATGAALCARLPHRRAALAAFSVLIAGSGAWLLAQYYRAAVTNGFSVYWTDGLPKLAQAVRAEGLPVAVLDWGIHNGLQIETRDLVSITEDVTPRTGILYAGHCDGYVVDESRRRQFDAWLTASPLHIVGSRSIPDREGRPVFCIFQLARNGSFD